ncbi:MAG: NAD-dependent malic enzyme [Fusobacteriaceae bacterium]|nr:NAD-dependent malic enzyme [Fusobacteriaceae bacterium]MBN2838299.1 NAD-dependent malic enzyme [Fusobacteriaceae bacterium]
MDLYKKALELHEENRGKLEIKSKVKVENRDDLSLAYSPGVAEPCKEIHKNKEMIYKYTSKGNMVAVITDGSAVLGLGNIGPYAALPVMEGKSILLKEFAGVDSFPLCLDTQDVEKFIETVKLLAPTFGGINLEDISAPRCIEIETRLKKELDIPVFHDDQHGTAIVVSAGLINGLKLVGKKVEEITVVVNGIGAAGSSIVKMMKLLGVNNILAVDRQGIIVENCNENNFLHEEIAKITNPNKVSGNLEKALENADVFIGVSAPNIVTEDMIKSMNKDSIVFAMANPTPEIMPDIAKKAGARIVGSGRSDFPNQINNVLAFPGIFRGALDSMATEINEEMKMATAMAIASIIKEDELTEEYVVPDAFDKRVVLAVAKAVGDIAEKMGIVRKI